MFFMFNFGAGWFLCMAYLLVKEKKKSCMKLATKKVGLSATVYCYN